METNYNKRHNGFIMRRVPKTDEDCVNAMAVLRCVAEFVRTHECGRGGDYDVSDDPVKCKSISLGYKDRWKLMTEVAKAIDGKWDVSEGLDVVEIRTKSGDDTLVKVGTDARGVRVSVNESLLRDETYGKEASELWESILPLVP